MTTLRESGMTLNLSALENEARELTRLYSPQESMLVSSEEVLALVRIARAAQILHDSHVALGDYMDKCLRDAGLIE